MKEKFPSELQEKFTVRFPDGMRDRIAEIARLNNRSMNAEIVNMLHISIKEEEKLHEIYKQFGNWDEKTPLTNQIFGEEDTYTFTESELEIYIQAEIENFKISLLASMQKNKNK